MKDCNNRQYSVEQTGFVTYADGTGNTLISPDIALTILDFGSAVVVDGLHAHILLTTTKLGSVNGDEESLDTTLLCVLDVFLGNFPVPVDIELDKQWLTR